LNGFSLSSFEPIHWLAKYSLYPRELAVRCFSWCKNTRLPGFNFFLIANRVDQPRDHADCPVYSKIRGYKIKTIALQNYIGI